MAFIVMKPGYHEARLPPDRRRDVLWEVLWQAFFSKRVAKEFCVLDLGSGYGQFINNAVARRRIAVDAWPEFTRHLDAGVEAIIASVTDLSAVGAGTVDYAFASNLFEHLSQAEFASVLMQLRAKLSASGTLTILQPNYRHAYREYFDDYTHVSIYSHVSLTDFLVANGYEVIELHPQFLPLTIKSRLPVWPWLIRLYLALPFKPLGKQMLVVARPKRPD